MLSRPRLTIAAAGVATALVSVPILASVAIGADEVVVRSGDTLTAIARRHELSIERLVDLNDLADPNRIFVGQRLRLEPVRAATAAGPSATARARTHTVRAGEHLTGIARAYGTTIAEIVAANGLADPSRIFAGQRLTIPGARGATSGRKPAASRAGMPASMAAVVGERHAVRRLIVAEADRFGVPRAFALAVAWQESGWQQGVVSWAGAIGVMQLLPATGEWVGEAMLGTRVDLRDARQNVRAGVRLLAHYLDRYDGNRDLVLAAYYQGQTAADRHGVYAVSRPYIASIKVLEGLFGG